MKKISNIQIHLTEHRLCYKDAETPAELPTSTEVVAPEPAELVAEARSDAEATVTKLQKQTERARRFKSTVDIFDTTITSLESGESAASIFKNTMASIENSDLNAAEKQEFKLAATVYKFLFALLSRMDPSFAQEFNENGATLKKINAAQEQVDYQKERQAEKETELVRQTWNEVKTDLQPENRTLDLVELRDGHLEITFSGNVPADIKDLLDPLTNKFNSAVINNNKLTVTGFDLEKIEAGDPNLKDLLKEVASFTAE